MIIMFSISDLVDISCILRWDVIYLRIQINDTYICHWVTGSKRFPFRSHQWRPKVTSQCEPSPSLPGIINKLCGNCWGWKLDRVLCVGGWPCSSLNPNSISSMVGVSHWELQDGMVEGVNGGSFNGIVFSKNNPLFTSFTIFVKWSIKIVDNSAFPN